MFLSFVHVLSVSSLFVLCLLHHFLVHMAVISWFSDFFFVGFLIWVFWKGTYYVSPSTNLRTFASESALISSETADSFNEVSLQLSLRWLRYFLFSLAVLGCIWMSKKQLGWPESLHTLVWSSKGRIFISAWRDVLKNSSNKTSVPRTF